MNFEHVAVELSEHDCRCGILRRESGGIEAGVVLDGRIVGDDVDDFSSVINIDDFSVLISSIESRIQGVSSVVVDELVERCEVSAELSLVDFGLLLTVWNSSGIFEGRVGQDVWNADVSRSLRSGSEVSSSLADTEGVIGVVDSDDSLVAVEVQDAAVSESGV